MPAENEGDALIDFIVLKFVSISLVNEREPFPTIYMVLDPNNLEVWGKIFVNDSQILAGLTLDKIKKLVSKVLDVDEWEQERDVPWRCWELYAIIFLDKKVRLINPKDRFVVSFEEMKRIHK